MRSEIGFGGAALCAASRRAWPCATVLLAAVAYAADCAPLTKIQHYIHSSWTALRRSNASADPKVASAEILYLPHPYVVPGGRFNEMYGWDSYFIQLGLLQDGKLQLAKGMTDNLVYEVEHYGKVLNANRPYYLTRSQPPFLTRMILDIFERTHNRRWLKDTLPAIEKYYAYWNTEPHLNSQTGLARYDGGDDTPAPEVVEGERDGFGRNHYDRVREYYRTHTVEEYDRARFYDAAADRLTPLFYRADRAMRESGFDPSARFGPFSAGILDYNPVDLNCLLYRMERDTASAYMTLGQPGEADAWTKRAETRAAAINRLMWDEAAGLYFDYDFVRGRRSGYRFLTTFYPLWAGIASQQQAAKVAANLPLFERSGGLQTSTEVTGNQWDAPFGWAPLQIIATEGLRRYGFGDAADRIAVEFLSMVLRDFTEHGTIKEKYDVVTARSDVAAGLKFGYTSNEIGFGWTNAAFLVLYSELSSGSRQKFRATCTAAPSLNRELAFQAAC